MEPTVPDPASICTGRWGLRFLSAGRAQYNPAYAVNQQRERDEDQDEFDGDDGAKHTDESEDHREES